MPDDDRRPPPSKRRRHSHPEIDPTDWTTWPEICPDCGSRIRRKRQCMGHISSGPKQGQHCGRIARLGLTVCPKHGGSTKVAIAVGLARDVEAKAMRRMVRFGTPETVDAHAAIERELHRCAGNVAWLEAQIRSCQTAAGDPVSDEDLVEPNPDLLIVDGKPSPLMSLYWEERNKLRATARACIELGIEERRVRIAEEQAEFVMTAMTAALNELGIDLEIAGPVVARHLRAVPLAS